MTKKLSYEEQFAIKAKLWRAGKLRYKLHAGQRDIYDKYRQWKDYALAERQAGRKLPGLYPRIYQMSCSRRLGKDYLGVTLMLEEALRKPGARLTYATSFQKDIASIVIPIFELICEDAPLDVKPVFKQSFQGVESGYYLPNGSVILLVGVERNPDSLRGRYSDGIVWSEAAFSDKLEYAILSVLLPQLQGRLDATIILNSTPPEIPGQWYDTALTPDCQENGRFILKTIDDNPLLSQAERAEFIAAAGGRDSERCRREYYCEVIRSTDVVVLPEFSVEKHVRESPEPKFAIGFTCLDPGVRDLCAVACGYYDFERSKLVFKRCWAKKGANTEEVAAAIRVLEADVFGRNSEKLRFWNGRQMANNPFQRFSDTEARLILDLSTIHKLRVAAADKQDAEAALNALRVALQTDRIEVDPAAKEMISHLQNAVWNQHRTSYARSPVFGHFDMLDVAKYAWRMVSPSFRMNPVPPAGHQAVMAGQNRHNVLWHAGDWSHGSSVFEKLSQILPKRGKSHSLFGKK